MPFRLFLDNRQTSPPLVGSLMLRPANRLSGDGHPGGMLYERQSVMLILSQRLVLVVSGKKLPFKVVLPLPHTASLTRPSKHWHRNARQCSDGNDASLEVRTPRVLQYPSIKIQIINIIGGTSISTRYREAVVTNIHRSCRHRDWFRTVMEARPIPQGASDMSHNAQHITDTGVGASGLTS